MGDVPQPRHDGVVVGVRGFRDLRRGTVRSWGRAEPPAAPRAACAQRVPSRGQWDPPQTHLEEEAEDSQPVGMPLGLCQRPVLDVDVDDVQLGEAWRGQGWATAPGRPHQQQGTCPCISLASLGQLDTEPTTPQKNPPSRRVLPWGGRPEDQSTPMKRASFEGGGEKGSAVPGCPPAAIHKFCSLLW